MIASNLVNIFITSVLFLGQHALAYEHHHHVRSPHDHDHEHDGHGRHLLYGESGQFSTFEEWVESDEFITSGARCGTPPAPLEPTEAELAFQEWVKDNPTFPEQQTVRNVDVIWHDIRLNDGTEGATTAQIVASIEALNTVYQSSGFRFVLLKNKTTANTDFWNAIPGDVEIAMKTQLREGSCSTLNVYSTGQTKVLGWAYLPEACSSSVIRDGVVINYKTVPGGSDVKYNQGDTLVHEVGHWLGLYHTFSGCADPGDYVDDTPPEATPDYVCDKKKNECGCGPSDDVTNFMNYGPDNCLDHFTAGQIARMQAQYLLYRSGAPIPTPAPREKPVPVYSQIVQAVTGFVSRAGESLFP